jgi:hypothetical protein
MRNIIIIVAFSVAMFIANLANAGVTLTGDSHTKLGDYQLSSSTNMLVVDDVAYKTWDLSYTGCNEKYTLFFVPGSSGNCCFTVRGKDFEIRYAIAPEGFGARLVDSQFRTISKKDVMKRINKDQLLSQEILTTNHLSEEEYLGMIACFLPLLMN